jgi:outer membrane protein
MRRFDFHKFFVFLTITAVASTSGMAQSSTVREPDIVVVPLSEQKSHLEGGQASKPSPLPNISSGSRTDVSTDDSSNKQEDLRLLKEAQSPDMSAGPREPLTLGQKKELKEFPIEWEEEKSSRNESEKKDKETAAPRSICQTLEEAYMQNAELDAARAGLRVKVETLSQANADWRPSFSVQGTQGNDWHGAIGQPAPGDPGRWNEYRTEYSVQATQNIFKGGQTVAKIGEAESNVFAGTYDLVSKEQSTLYAAISAHADVIAKEATLRNQQETQAFSKKRYEEAEARYEVGEGSRSDVAIAEGEYEQTTAEVAVALGYLEASKANYLYQVGTSPEKLTPPEIIVDIPKTCEEVVQIAEKKNPSIVSAKYALEAAEYNVNVQAADLLPTLNVQGNFGNDRRGGTVLPSPYDNPVETNASFKGILNVPLYLQGIPNSKIRQAYQIVAQQKVNLINAQRKVIQDANTTWATYLASQESLKSFIAQVRALEVAVEGSLEEYKVGLKSIVDVFVQRDKLTQAQNRLAIAQQKLVESSYGVFQAMGRLTACDLKLRVKYYDPEVYYRQYKEAWIQFWKGEDTRYVTEVNPK